MGTRFLCLLFKFLVLLYFDTVVDVFPASVSQNDSSVIGLACFRGIELLHIHFAGFKERGGNLRGKSGLAFLEKAVILPHDKGTFFVAAIIVFLDLLLLHEAGKGIARNLRIVMQGFMVLEIHIRLERRFLCLCRRPVVLYSFS